MADSLFDRVSPKHRWTGALGDLYPELKSRAWGIGHSHATPALEKLARETDDDFAWVVLPRGAVVGVRVRGDLSMRRELRIARPDAPEGTKAEKAWETECRVFCEAFGIAWPPLTGEEPSDGCYWLRLPPNSKDEGKAALRLLELRKGELRPQVARCHKCLEEDGEYKEVPWYPGGGITGQHCPNHAMDQGRKDVVRRRMEVTP